MQPLVVVGKLLKNGAPVLYISSKANTNQQCKSSV
jgi:hypothetical protein